MKTPEEDFGRTFRPATLLRRVAPLPWLAGLLFAAAGLRAQVPNATWILPGAGSYTTALDWDIGIIPTTTYNIFITNGTSLLPTTVTLAGSAGAANIQIGANNTLVLGLGSAMTVAGTQIVDNGALNINAGSANNTILGLNVSVTLSGTGTLTLNSGDNNGQAYLQQSAGGVTLTNQNSTIAGYGVVGNGGLAVNNQATIAANVLNQTLTLNGSGGLTNSGTLESANGGVLSLATGGTIANAGGTIQAGNASTVSLTSGTTVSGGTLATVGTGVMQTLGTANLAGVTVATGSTYTGTLGSATNLSGTVTNQGNLQVNAGGGNNTVLGLSANTTLSGGGTVTLNSGDLNGQVLLQQQAAGLTLTNANNTIQGYGVIGNGGLAVVNQSTINANIGSRTLTLNGSGGLTNTGLLEATGGGTLSLGTGGTIANAGGTLEAGTGSTVVMTGGTTVNGGTLTTLGTGVMQTSGSASLVGVTLSAGSTYTGALGTTTNLSGTVINQGTFQVNAGSGNNTILGLAANTTLSGGGTVTLNSGDNNGQAYLQQQSAGLTLTNANNTIQGYGVLGNGGLAVVNQSTVNANVAGQTLTVNAGGGVTNTTGLLEATNGATLLISTVVNNQGGNITSNGGTVNVVSTVQGGTLNGTALRTTGTALLDGSTAAGALTLATGGIWSGGLGTTTDVNGSIVNQGTFTITAGSGNNTFLGLTGNTALSGGGTVTLNSGDNNGQAYLQQQAANLTLTNTNNTIQGYGVLGNGGLTFVNQATLNANVLNQTLTLNPGGGTTNAGGLLEATNGGTLVISSIVNNQSGTISSNGGTVNVVSTVQGGTLNGAALKTTGVALLDGSTAAGALTLAAGGVWTGGLGTTTNLNGSIVNQSTFTITAGSANNTYLGLTGNTTLSGGGTFTLNSGDNNGQAYIQQQAANLTLTNTNDTIQGYGVLGNGGLTFVNQGTVNANALNQTLTLNPGGGITNTGGLLEVTNGGTLVISALTNNQGGTIASNGGTVNVVAGNAIQGGTLTGAGFETTSSALLDGSTASGAVTLATGTYWTGNLGTTTNLNGSIVNQGVIEIKAGSGSNTILGLSGNTSLSGGGVILLNSGDNNGLAYIQQQVANLTLTNAGDVIEGYGVIGNGGLALINSAAGSILASVAGKTLTLNGSGGLTNNGTLAVASGATMQINTNLPNNGQIALVADASGAATLTLSGSYVQSATGSLTDTIGPSFSGVFSVTGNVTLGGTLIASLLGAYQPAIGTTFPLISYTGTESGAFTSVVGLYNSLWSVLYNPGQVELQFNGFQPVPEPGVSALLLLGLVPTALLGLVRRRRLGRKGPPATTIL